MGDIEGGAVSHGTNKNRLELLKAAIVNDWKKAEIIYRESRMEYGTRITWYGETALHVAAFSGNTDFVEKLVEKMNVDDIRIQMENGDTAFHCAAVSGSVKIAEAILSKDPQLDDLTMARGYDNNLPIYMAAVRGNKKMVRYLYEKTKDKLQDPNNRTVLAGDRKELLVTLINSDIYDVALEMAKALIDKNIAPESMEEKALAALVEKPLKLFPDSGELVQLLWDKITHNESRARGFIENNDVENVILKAAILGNFKFLSILIASYPHVLSAWDESDYTIFHHAILNRHVDIFKLIHISSVKLAATVLKDNDGNNMLHLAGKLAPPNRLNIVPGAALQLQRELLWFEEVKKVMAPHQVMQKVMSIQDNKTYTPYELFIKEHKQLMAEGEKWMRDTANSCMIVTALITTIAFAAAITIPGGNGDDGYPHFASEPLLKAFAVADSVSLVSSTTSLLTFLSILTARYTIDDFRRSLPNKLFIGLLTLFVSIVAMMVAFVLSIFIIFKNTPTVLTLLLVAVSSLPIIIFIWHHSRLFLDLFHSTYTSHLLFKPAKDPNLLMK